MNLTSNSNQYDRDKRACYDPCEPKYAPYPKGVDIHPVPGGALLEAGRGYTPLVNAVNDATISPTNPALIAQVSIDTTGFCSPNLLIQFSSLINLTSTLVGTETLTVQLSRVNYGYSSIPLVREPLETYIINLPAVTAVTSPDSLPFSFIYPEENVASRESTYFVEIVGASTFTAGGSAQFQNVNIAALAVGPERRLK